MPNLNILLKHARTGNVDKLKPLVSQYSGAELGQVLRAAIVENHSGCVEFLVPYVALCQDVDAAQLTPLDHAFWTTIVHKKDNFFDCIFKHIDAKKNNSSFLYMACQFGNCYAASCLVPLSDIHAVWEKMQKNNLEKECFDIIRPDYDAFKQKQLLNTVVGCKKETKQRKI